ncbi:MAG TPA: alpha-xenorhabdolysin family binary toxin subunit A [Symbiobacteriaceae bacterium]|nr:alpha-xenorhabdolysin family binary toxin subunit A [Symbiobacteriaceae bacterium]
MPDKLSLAPNGMTDPETNSFILSRGEWINVQRYVAEAVQLPTNQDALRSYLKGDPTLPLDSFGDMLQIYTQMNSHGHAWQDETFPATVLLANDIVHYANKATVYFKPLRDAVARLVENMDSKRDQQMVAAICDQMAKEADAFAKKAAVVKERVTEFANQSGADYDRLRTVHADMNKKWGDGSADLKDLQKNVKELKELINALNDEYNHDVVVAATSPTYAWVFPFGTIAAAVVAGVYGDRAVKALKKIEETKASLAQFEDKVAARFKLLNGMENAVNGMKGIQDALAAALPVIGKIQGLWTAIATDLGRLKEIINGDIRDNLPILMDLGIDLAIVTWQQIGQKADAYQVNAFIKFVDTPAA